MSFNEQGFDQCQKLSASKTGKGDRAFHMPSKTTLDQVTQNALLYNNLVAECSETRYS